jgi:hypothetical protein
VEVDALVLWPDGKQDIVRVHKSAGGLPVFAEAVFDHPDLAEASLDEALASRARIDRERAADELAKKVSRVTAGEWRVVECVEGEAATADGVDMH